MSDPDLERQSVSPLLAVVAAVALSLAIQFGSGTLTRPGIRYLSLALIAAIAALAVNAELPKRAVSNALKLALIGAIVVQSYFYFTARPGVYFEPTESGTRFLHGAVALAGSLSMLMVILRGRGAAVVFWVALLVHFCLGVWLIHSSPDPGVDVHILFKKALDTLWSGHDPYGGSVPVNPADLPYYGEGVVQDGRLQLGFAYPPLSLVLPGLGELVAGDYRYVEWIAILVTSILISRIGSGPWSRLAALAFLLTPRSLYILENGFTDMLLCPLLAAIVLCAARRKDWLWLPLGGLFAMKQYSILFAPLVVLLFDRSQSRLAIRTALLASAVAALTIIPFVLWDPNAFVRDVISVHLRGPFRPDSLTYSAWWAKRGYWHPTWLGGVFVIVANAVIVWRVRRTPRAFPLAVAVCGLVFFAFAKHSFSNYYYFLIAALWTGVAAGASSPPCDASPAVAPRGPRVTGGPKPEAPR